MLMDLADSPGLVTVEGPDRLCQSLVAAIGLCLVASRWSSGVDVIVVGESLRWLAQIGIEDVQPMTTDEVSRALQWWTCLLYTSPSPRDATLSRMPSSA